MKEKEALQAALLKRAIGYDYEEKKIIADKNGKPQKLRFIISTCRRILQRRSWWQDY